ncbi:helix-turn-helix domain-containing protein [Lysinibacillus sp. NPDC048646]|uniref:helix-turn-helix domain-containing protein n=1 Tax=Lysinibacillus sp. NPDC048646 TaxID=3390574 RepID=UPI003D034BE7
MIRYINGQQSIHHIAREAGINKPELRTWVCLYEHHGTEAFMKSYISYSTEFKMDVLNDMNETGMSLIDPAANEER